MIEWSIDWFIDRFDDWLSDFLLLSTNDAGFLFYDSGRYFAG